MNQPQPGSSQQSEARILTENEIREALIAYVSKNICAGSGAARGMHIDSIRMYNAYRYITDEIIETREVCWKTVPYNWTMIIDSPENGSAVSIWDIQAQPPKDFNFKKLQLSYEMPHSASVCKCSKCLHSGQVACRPCNNSGFNPCSHCKGIGTVTKHFGQGKSETRNCVCCQGRAQVHCRLCNGLGRVDCGTCSGSGSVKKFQSLQVSWSTSSNCTIIKTQSSAIPEQFLARATGEKAVYLINGCDPNENALSRFPDIGVRTASLKAFEKYNDASLAVHNRKILKVRQTVVTILIAEVIAKWKGKDEIFYVIGNEKRVFFPTGYPQACCGFWKSPC